MKVTHTYDHYYRYHEITQILQEYVSAYPQYCRLTSLGKTGEGRDIWKFELTDLSSGDFSEKPALCVTGNIHAGEVTGSMCAMYFLDYLLSNRDTPEIAPLLKAFTVYCVPRISPDGSELYLTTPVQLRSVNKPHPFDEPQPGVQPEDIDGDGVIRLMRVKAKNGVWKISKKDPRVMAKRRPDDMDGEFYNLYSEGKVLDFDGVSLQPAPALYGNDLNRNFPCNWLPENKQAGSGAYALSNVESQTMAKFIHSQKNLCAILNFHTMGGMYLFPPGMKSAKDCPKEDMERYREIGKMATEETTYPAVNIKDDYVGNANMSVVGAFDDFNHFVMGIMDFTCECWDLNPRVGFPHPWPRPQSIPDETQEDIAVARLKWVDEQNDGQGFKDWTVFQHPELGEVEIGGLDNKTVVQNCPVKFLPQEVEKHTKFLLRYLKTLPRLSLDQPKVTPVGGDCYQIDAVVENLGYLPTYITKEAVELRVAQPLTAQLSGDGVQILAGKEKESIGHLQGFSGVKVTYGHIGPTTSSHDPCAKKLSWVVKAQPGSEITLTVSAPRAGKASATILLPR